MDDVVDVVIIPGVIVNVADVGEGDGLAAGPGVLFTSLASIPNRLYPFGAGGTSVKTQSKLLAGLSK
jgi:hypothetical protein